MKIILLKDKELENIVGGAIGVMIFRGPEVAAEAIANSPAIYNVPFRV